MQPDNKPQSTLVNFSPEEGKAVIEALDGFMKEHSAELVVTPMITQQGTIGAKVEIFRKVELVPKEAEGIVSPIQDVGKGSEESGQAA